MPLFLARILTTLIPQMRPLRPQLGYDFDTSAKKAQRMLGWYPRPMADSLQDTAESLLEHDRRVVTGSVAALRCRP